MITDIYVLMHTLHMYTCVYVIHVYIYISSCTFDKREKKQQNLRFNYHTKNNRNGM